jgi:hypothetical protein
LRPGTSSNAQGLSIHLNTERTITFGAGVNLAEKDVFNKGIGARRLRLDEVREEGVSSL